jgi:hypothetical protein
VREIFVAGLAVLVAFKAYVLAQIALALIVQQEIPHKVSAHEALAVKALPAALLDLARPQHQGQKLPKNQAVAPLWDSVGIGDNTC